MDWFGLLDKFEIDLEHPEKLQIGAKTAAYTLVYVPLSSHCDTKIDEMMKETCKQKVQDHVYSVMKNGFQGNILKRTAIVKNFISNAKKASSLRNAKMTDISFDSIVRIASGMHLHQMSDSDFEALAKEVTNLLLDNGPLQQMAENQMVLDDTNLKVVTAIGADRFYTAFIASLEERNSLQHAYEQSAAKHGEIH